MADLSKLNASRLRAEKLAAVRAFFAARGVLEIEAPLLSRGASHDAHIGAFEVPAADSPRYLQTSPEPHLKRLLARGYPDVYSIAKSFRIEESGRLHNPEFTMVEWYRLGFKLRRMMEETVALCALVAGDREADFKLYVETFQAVTGLHPRKSTREQLLAHPVFAGRGWSSKDTAALFPEKTDVLNFLMSEVVEPGFDPAKFTVVHHFPIEMAAQAEPDQEEPFLAQRFEVYSGGMELANGYKELIDSREYRTRFEAENAKRVAAGKPVIPLHGGFFADLGAGLPACAGVAVGFDRLLMLALNTRDIRDVLEFPWDEA
ncbi:MAG TPA: EF-P lysine aminoacylase EpmA [Fibrobacteria bacterium]|nr:EF-P lysine aminoacylase EpmA [Fibrobacteria bacterium]